MLVSELLKKIPAHTQASVDMACSSWNTKIRNKLSGDVLRWVLTHRSAQRTQTSKLTTDWAQIGSDKKFTEREIPPGRELAALLAIHGPAIKHLRLSANELQVFFEDTPIDRWNGTEIDADDADDTLYDACELAEQLQALASPVDPVTGESFDLAKYLLAVNDDILGHYKFSGDHGENRNPVGKIFVYWGVVGLFARILGVEAGPLAIVVLAHEYAHGYSHLGYDRDGNRWSGNDFAGSEHELCEAIAQYYTHLIVHSIEPSFPGVVHAYEALMRKQTRAYRCHLPWLLGASPEEVGRVIGNIRHKPGKYKDVCKQLNVEPFQGKDKEFEKMLSKLKAKESM